MELYLVRHGKAVAEEEDPGRPLTEAGSKESRRVASAAAGMGIQVASIWHSGKLRARQTAELFAERLNPAQGPSERRGLAPMDDPGAVLEALDELPSPAMLIGHLPHLSRLASSLLVGDPGREIVAFRESAVVCLERGNEAWRLVWVLTPEIAREVETQEG